MAVEYKICGRCGVYLRWIETHTVGLWVHSDSGLYMSNINGRHDANTYVTTPATGTK